MANHTRTPGMKSPVDAYGATLLQAEDILKTSDLGDRLTILRPAMVYGPDDRELLPWMKMLQRGLVPLRSECELSFLHVADLADFIVHHLGAPSIVGPVFLSQGPPRELAGVADIIEQALSGTASVRLFVPKGLMKGAARALGFVTQRSGLLAPLSDSVNALTQAVGLANAGEARSLLGFRPTISLEVGFAQTVKAYRVRGLL